MEEASAFAAQYREIKVLEKKYQVRYL